MSHGPFLGCLLHSQVNEFDQSLLIREAGFVLGYFFDLPVQALDGIRRVDQGPDFRRIFEEG